MRPSLTSSPPSPMPTPPSPNGGCVRGHGGIPDSPLGDLLCGTWGDDALGTIWHLVRDRWPWLAAIVIVLVGTFCAVVAWRRARWREHAGHARWLQMIPPVTATPATTVELWRLLATVLPPPRRWGTRPPRIVWEVQADPDGMRCGLWLPPGINPTAVVRIVHRAWPGVRAEQARPPVTATTDTVAAVALRPTQPEWLPLVEDTGTAVTRRWDTSSPEQDRLRAVYDGLAAAGRTGGGLLQVHVSRAPAHRLRLLRRAMTNPDKARRPRGASRAVSLLADGVRAFILLVLNVITPGPSSRRAPSPRTDPYTADLARQARAKYAAAPHLLVAVHATATGPTRAAALAAAADITSGYGLLSAHFARRRLRRGAVEAVSRWVPESRMTLASVDEAAALAGLPTEPAAFGLPAAASRRRAAGRDTFRTTTTSTGTSARPAAPRPAGRPEPPDAASGDNLPPTVWSTP